MADKVTITTPPEGDNQAVVDPGTQQVQPQSMAPPAESVKAGETDPGFQGIEIKDPEPEPKEFPHEQENKPEVPKKFLKEDGTVDQEALLKSYTELEKKLGSRAEPAQEDTPKEPEATPTEEVPQDTNAQIESAEQLVESLGMNFSELQDTYAQNGQLTDEQLAQFEAKGYPKALVNDYLKAMTELATQAEEKGNAMLAEMAGGKEKLDQMFQWASEKYTQQEQEAFNGLLKSGDEAQVKFAMEAMKNRFEADQGVTPEVRLSGDVSATTQTNRSRFSSDYEVQMAMQDPRYTTDKQYEREVNRQAALFAQQKQAS